MKTVTVYEDGQNFRIVAGAHEKHLGADQSRTRVYQALDMRQAVHAAISGETRTDIKTQLRRFLDSDTEPSPRKRRIDAIPSRAEERRREHLQRMARESHEFESLRDEIDSLSSEASPVHGPETPELSARPIVPTAADVPASTSERAPVAAGNSDGVSLDTHAQVKS